MARLDYPSSAVSCERGRSDADRTVVWVRGEHDIATNAWLAAVIAHAAQPENAAVVVDLSEVTFMDASTVGILVGCSNRLRSRPHSFELRAPSVPALRILELCGLTHLVLAAAAVRAPRPPGAGALATWVEIPSTESGEVTEPDAHHALPRRTLSAEAAAVVDAVVDADPTASPLGVGITVEADGGGR